MTDIDHCKGLSGWLKALYTQASLRVVSPYVEGTVVSFWCSDGETDVHGSDGDAGPVPHQLLLLHSGCFHALRGQTGELLFCLSLFLCSTNV